MYAGEDANIQAQLADWTSQFNNAVHAIRPAVAVQTINIRDGPARVNNHANMIRGQINSQQAVRDAVAPLIVGGVSHRDIAVMFAYCCSAGQRPGFSLFEEEVVDLP